MCFVWNTDLGLRIHCFEAQILLVFMHTFLTDHEALSPKSTNCFTVAVKRLFFLIFTPKTRFAFSTLVSIDLILGMHIIIVGDFCEDLIFSEHLQYGLRLECQPNVFVSS
jgi:hypothetical protein